MPSFSSCSEWFQWIEDWRATKDSKDRMYVITASTLWMLWRYRNSLTFNSHLMRKCDIPRPGWIHFWLLSSILEDIKNVVFDAVSISSNSGNIPKLSSSLSISHLFYADDAVFMGQWCDGNISTLIHVLECFYRASGLRINMSKSKILGVNVDSDKVKGAASKLGCLILKTPFTYLGSKVGGSMSRVHAWNEVIDRVKNRLSKWKMKTLSIGGRLTLLKSVLGSIPIFHMSIYRAPLSVLRTLESIRSKFFKGHDINSNKASWVNWKKVLASKEKGGLGVSSLFALNRGDHGYDGNGDKTVFWEDIWIDGKTLKNRFPRIMYVVVNLAKLITVGAKLAQLVWNIISIESEGWSCGVWWGDVGEGGREEGPGRRDQFKRVVSF
ncbi:hypothetical protein Tco_0058257 [Tanacetum coccineum]